MAELWASTDAISWDMLLAEAVVSTSTTPSLFHFRLKACFFHRSFLP